MCRRRCGGLMQRPNGSRDPLGSDGRTCSAWPRSFTKCCGPAGSPRLATKRRPSLTEIAGGDLSGSARCSDARLPKSPEPGSTPPSTLPARFRRRSPSAPHALGHGLTSTRSSARRRTRCAKKRPLNPNRAFHSMPRRSRSANRPRPSTGSKRSHPSPFSCAVISISTCSTCAAMLSWTGLRQLSQRCRRSSRPRGWL